MFGDISGMSAPEPPRWDLGGSGLLFHTPSSGRRTGRPGFLALAAQALLGSDDEAAEQLNVKSRSARRCRPPLHTNGKPGGALGFDGFCHTVQGNRTHAKTVGRPCNRAAVLAV